MNVIKTMCTQYFILFISGFSLTMFYLFFFFLLTINIIIPIITIQTKGDVAGGSSSGICSSTHKSDVSFQKLVSGHMHIYDVKLNCPPPSVQSLDGFEPPPPPPPLGVVQILLVQSSPDGHVPQLKVPSQLSSAEPQLNPKLEQVSGVQTIGISVQMLFWHSNPELQVPQLKVPPQVSSAVLQSNDKLEQVSGTHVVIQTFATHSSPESQIPQKIVSLHWSNALPQLNPRLGHVSGTHIASQIPPLQECPVSQFPQSTVLPQVSSQMSHS